MNKTHTTLLRPRITEKASMNAALGAYVFEIPKSATKIEVAKAVKELYKVSPVKVTTVTIPQKSVVIRGKRGKRAGYKKAYVYLKKGETIEIV